MMRVPFLIVRVANAPELVRPETRERVEATMRRLCYLPNAAAQSMRTNVSRTIGLETRSSAPAPITAPSVRW